MGIHQSIILISVLSFGFSDSLPQENNGSCPQSCIDAMDQQSMGPTLGKAAPHNLGGAVNYNRIEAMIERKFSEQKRWIRKKVKRLQVSSNEEMKTIEEHITSDINAMRSLVLSLLPASCEEAGKRSDGIVKIHLGGKIQEVYCDMTTDGGNWTVFQRRSDGSVDFYLTWEEYASGFGDKDGEFWLGLEIIHQLTQDGEYELRIDLTDWDGSTAYAKYRTFLISGRSDGYRITARGYSGTAGDSMRRHNGRRFSAKDKDLDPCKCNCATLSHGAWWYDICSTSNLNGKYEDTVNLYHGIFWDRWKGYRHSLKSSEMKFRKK